MLSEGLAFAEGRQHVVQRHSERGQDVGEVGKVSEGVGQAEGVDIDLGVWGEPSQKEHI